MSHKQEILMSNERDVLEQIRDPLVKVAIWVPPEKLFSVCLRFISEYRWALKNQPGLQENVEFHQRLSDSLTRLAGMHFGKVFDNAVEPIVSGAIQLNRDNESGFNLRSSTSDVPLGQNGKTHIDPGVLSAFVSVNDHLVDSRTGFVKRQHVHGPLTDGRFLPEVDCSQAFYPPGLSVYIAKVAEIPHFSSTFEASAAEDNDRPRILIDRRYRVSTRLNETDFPVRSV